MAHTIKQPVPSRAGYLSKEYSSVRAAMARTNRRVTKELLNSGLTADEVLDPRPRKTQGWASH